MATIYIVSNFGTLHKKGETLLLVNKDQSTTTIFPYKTDQLIILGKTNITSEALNLLMHYNIDTVFMGKSGKFNGKITFQTGKNVFLRQKQFKLLDNNDFKVNFSKIITRAKLKNQLVFLQKIARKEKNDIKLHDLTQKLKRNIQTLENIDNVDSIRGYEGYGAKLYFSGFKYGIFSDWATFNGRTMHPPKDNVNAILSFLYTLILFRVDSAIELAGLDPYVGYMHTLDYGKRSLTFDLMEEYRTPIADRLAITLINKEILKKDDFTSVNFSKEDNFPLSQEDSSETTIDKDNEGILLTKKGIRKVIKHFEKRLAEEIFYKPLNKRITYKKLINEQIKHFKRVINGEELEYKPLIIK